LAIGWSDVGCDMNPALADSYDSCTQDAATRWPMTFKWTRFNCPLVTHSAWTVESF